MQSFKILDNFDIFQISDKTVFKKKKKAKKISLSVSVYKLSLRGKNLTCLLASFANIPVLVSEGKYT